MSYHNVSVEEKRDLISNLMLQNVTKPRELFKSSEASIKCLMQGKNVAN